MTALSNIVELDQFRQIREALQSVRLPVTRPRKPPQALTWHLPGMVGKARIATAFGELPIEALRPRDDIRTYSGAIATVKVVDKIHLDQDFIRNHPSALPIRIPAGSIGPGRPTNDLYVSPGQEISLDAHVATAFRAAKNLSDKFRMDLTYSTGFTYYRFHFGFPAIVKVDGIWVRVSPWTNID